METYYEPQDLPKFEEIAEEASELGKKFFDYLGRFCQWLQHSGNLEKYLQNLASRFNPCAVEGLMCRMMISVSWDGYLYDCDFSLAKGLYMGRRKIHISEMAGPPKPGTPIAVSGHCYACTAGSGFTCGEAIVT